MKQSKKSWNIKFMMMLFEDYPKSLCALFWYQVWTFIWGIFCFPFFVVGKFLNLFLSKPNKRNNYFDLSLAGVGILIGALLTFSGIYMFIDFDPESPLFAAGVSFWGMVIVLIFAATYFYFRDKMNSSESLIEKYVKAKKSKICPIIEWED